MSGVAVAQFAPGPDRAANLGVMAELAQRAVDGGATLVVFPEYSSFFTPQPGPDWIAAAEGLDGPFTQGLAAIATGLGITVVAGLLETAAREAAAGERAAAGAKAHNTVVAIGPSGSRLAVYRKLHLYDAFGARESEWIAPGRLGAIETFAWGGFTVAMQTCYDIRFPELTRVLVAAGADLVLVPAEWVSGPLKEEHWRTLLAARAIENTVYLAAADHPAPVGVGNSMVLDPMGVELVGVRDGTDVAIAFPTVERLREAREKNPSLQLRRFEIAPKSP